MRPFSTPAAYGNEARCERKASCPRAFAQLFAGLECPSRFAQTSLPTSRPCPVSVASCLSPPLTLLHGSSTPPRSPARYHLRSLFFPNVISKGQRHFKASRLVPGRSELPTSLYCPKVSTSLSVSCWSLKTLLKLKTPVARRGPSGGCPGVADAAWRSAAAYTWNAISFERAWRSLPSSLRFLKEYSPLGFWTMRFWKSDAVCDNAGRRHNNRSPFYRRGNRGTERKRHLPKIPEPTKGRWV